MQRVPRSGHITSAASAGVDRQLIYLAIYVAVFAVGVTAGMMKFQFGRSEPPPTFATAADLPGPNGGPVKPPTADEVKARAAAAAAEASFVAASRQSLMRPCETSLRQAAIQTGHAFALAGGRAIQIGLAQRGPASRFDEVRTSVGAPVWNGRGAFDAGRQLDGRETMQALIEMEHVSPQELTKGDRIANLYLAQIVAKPQVWPAQMPEATPYCLGGRRGRSVADSLQ